jgi:hypothetical protein
MTGRQAVFTILVAGMLAEQKEHLAIFANYQ